MLTELHIRHSYSRKGCPYDNAPMESFHASLKKECVYPVPVFENYETAAAVLFEYVHAFHGSNKLLITINDLFELWKVNAVLNVS
nr:integrase core domain-containing protein [Weissella confusa]